MLSKVHHVINWNNYFNFIPITKSEFGCNLFNYLILSKKDMPCNNLESLFKT